MENPTVDAYVDYFRQLAVHHVDLQHDPGSETGDADPESCHFARWTADEIISGLRTKVSFPALMLELYETNTTAETELDVRPNYAGAFSVVTSALPENHTSEVAAFSTSENIMTDMLQKIWDDHFGIGQFRCSTPFEYWNVVYNITPFGPILNNEFGYRCEFTFNFKRDRKYSQPPAEGRFS
jgi:hypothetical protein